VDGKSWTQIDSKEGNDELNARQQTRTYAVAGGRECRFIRLANIGRNHNGCDALCVDAWEIFGTLIE
jgi:hypothetical protein